jgi:hypothetical protein
MLPLTEIVNATRARNQRVQRSSSLTSAFVPCSVAMAQPLVPVVALPSMSMRLLWISSLASSFSYQMDAASTVTAVMRLIPPPTRLQASIITVNALGGKPIVTVNP